MVRFLFYLVLTLAITSFSIPLARADEIVLDNGDQFTGTVTQMVDDVVTITSAYAAPIQVKKEYICSISTDEAVEVHLASGEIIKGALDTDDDGMIIIDQGPGRSTVGVDLKSVKSINPPPVERWHGNISIAGSVQSGNTDRSGVSVSADATRRGERDRFNMRFLYNIFQENDVLNTRNTFGSLEYHYFFTKKFYGYLAVELLNDTFKDLNLRTVVGPGVGYQIWDDPIKALSIEGGISYFSEDLRSQPDRRWFTLRIASDFRYKLAKWIQFADRLVLYPSLQSMSDFTLRNEAALTTALGAGWSMKLADVTDYVNNPPIGTRGTDNLLTFGLQYSF